MRYGQHDFYNNFCNASGQDEIVAKEILIDTISDLIIEKPETVIKAVQDAGIPVRAEVTQKELAIIIADNIWTNSAFQQAMASAMVMKNLDGMSNLTGTPLDAISGVFSSLGNIVQNQQQVNIEKEQTKQNLIQALIAKQNSGSNKMSAGAIAGLIVAGIAVVGIAAYLIIKAGKK